MTRFTITYLGYNNVLNDINIDHRRAPDERGGVQRLRERLKHANSSNSMGKLLRRRVYRLRTQNPRTQHLFRERDSPEWVQYDSIILLSLPAASALASTAL